MNKSAAIVKNKIKENSNVKSNLRRSWKNVSKFQGNSRVGEKKINLHLKIKEKIKEKRTAKAQQKQLKKVEEESLRQKEYKEKTDAKLRSKKKRLERTKIISKRTHRGQPLMKDRIHLLLNKIQELKRT